MPRDPGAYAAGAPDGTLVAREMFMTIFVYTCERCTELAVGEPYRVISDSDGERLLDMIVCYGCHLEAWQLGLATETVAGAEHVLH